MDRDLLISGASAFDREKQMSLGIVERKPTQFDEPLYRFLATETNLRCTVYYYGADSPNVSFDAEIGQCVGWQPFSEEGYTARFCPRLSALRFARLVVGAGHDLIVTPAVRDSHAVCTALLSKIRGNPVGLRHDHILSIDGQSFSWRIKSQLYRWMRGIYSTGHPVGRQAGEYLRHFGFTEETLFLFPYAVDHEWFALESSRARETVPDLRDKWRLPRGAQVVCGVMKFSPREDPLTLVRAFHIARRQIPELALLLVGDGSLRKQVEDACGEQLGKSIQLPGYQQYGTLPSVYAAGDVFVHTAIGQWEVSVNEALACGLPVIAADTVGSAEELVLPHHLGLVFKRGDAAKLASHIVQVFRDSQLRARVRENGLKSLEPWFYKATAERFAAAIRFVREKQHVS
jgi:glycosyltransferase involved in cell wall biosynthesis